MNEAPLSAGRLSLTVSDLLSPPAARSSWSRLAGEAR
jgi:hypothetical protein